MVILFKEASIQQPGLEKGFIIMNHVIPSSARDMAPDFLFCIGIGRNLGRFINTSSC
jgi:hypothetical protein